MNPGDIVRVYRDPVTCQNFEWWAKLIEFISRDPDGNQPAERWIVEFDGDPTRCRFERGINTERI